VRVVRERSVTVALLAFFALTAIAGGIAIAVWWPGTIAVGVVVAYVVGHVIVIPNPSGRVVPVLPAVAAAAALVTLSPLLVLGGAAVALPLGWGLIRLRHGRRVAASTFPAEPIGLAVFAGVFFGGTSLLQESDASHPLVLAIFALAVLAWFGAAVVVRSVWLQHRRTVSSRLVRLWALADWPAYAALFSSAALFAVTVEAMGWWSIPLAGLPYLFSHLSLDRVQDTRRTYDQTIRALGAIPEASGQVADGHSGRTADLSVAVGSELGFGAGSLRRLEYAALLHDLGRVVLSNPAVASGEYSFADVSGWSAAIITEARYLEPVADIVASMHAPYRKPGEHRDPSVPLGSQIVRVTARYDSALDEGIRPIEAMELLHKGVAYDYDPEIVMALRRVLERRGEIAA
jgi:hypothetical protein